MDWIANLVYWALGACVVAGFGAIAFVWERMRRDLNLALPAEQSVSIYPPLRTSFREIIFRTNDLGHFIEVLDQYQDMYPYSALPKKLALGLVAWILCFMGLLASGVGPSY
ncbi:MAG: hypothetical protein ACRD3P_20140 [Terriglobales bacterium]